jgi:hypothetical protein
LVGRSLGRTVAWSVGRLVVWSVGRLVDYQQLNSIARLGHRLTSTSLNQQSLFLHHTCMSIPADRSSSPSLLLPIAPPANRTSRSSLAQPIAQSTISISAKHLLVHPSKSLRQHIAPSAHCSTSQSHFEVIA